jgi:hypothetical protein
MKRLAPKNSIKGRGQRSEIRGQGKRERGNKGTRESDFGRVLIVGGFLAHSQTVDDYSLIPDL